MAASVIVAVASSYIAESIAAAVITDAFIASASWITYAGTTAAIQAGVGFAINSAISGGGNDAAPAQTNTNAFTSQATQRTHVLRSAVANRSIIYGQAMVSGPLIFAASTNSNNTLHLVIGLAGHEVEEIGDIHFNDKVLGTLDGNGLVTDGDFANLVTVKKYLGTATQTADAGLVAADVGWTTDHRLQGVAYIYLKMEYSRDKFPRGIPNIKCVVKGKKLYDPRSATTAWSANPALAVRDYLTSSYGLACSSAEIDEASFIAAANLCDEAVTLVAGGTESRYTCNGVVDTGGRPLDNIQAMLTAMGGVLVWTQGQYVVHGAAYTAPAVTLTADDLRGKVTVRPRQPRQRLYNAVRGTYVDPGKYWQPGDFTPVTNSTYAGDDGAVIYRDVALPMTTSAATAQRLAKIMLEKSRQAITVEFPAKATAVRLAVWDTVRITLPALGWSAKEFKVVGWELGDNGGVNLSLQEEAAACYAWSAEEVIADPAPDTNLPDPFNVAAPGVPAVAEELYETREGGGVKVRALISCAAADDAFVERYQFEWRPVGASTWQVLGQSTATSLVVYDVAAGRYDVRVKAINTLGVSSAYATRSNVEIVGLAGVPADIAGLGIQAAGGLAILTWALHPDLDVRIGGKIRVRHAASMAGATWETSVSIGEAVSGNTTVAVLPLKEGTYLVKAEDSSGILSAVAAAISTKQASALAWSPLTSVQEDDDFTGAHASTFVGSLMLQLRGTGLIDDAPDFDSIVSLDYYGGVAASGTYDFAAGMDLGSVQRVRLTSTLAAEIVSVNDLIDSRAALVDTWADFDGTAGASADAWVEVREADDDPAGTPTWSDWRRLDSAEFQARAFDFRCILTSADPAYTIRINQLRVAAANL